MFTIFALAATLTNPKFHYLQQVRYTGPLSGDAQFYECGKYSQFIVYKLTYDGKYSIFPKGTSSQDVCAMEVNETDIQEIK